jgi:hypothetical protein
MNLKTLVKRKTVEYNELVINREMLIELVRSQNIGVSDDVIVRQNPSKGTITMKWERSTGDG